MVFNNVVLARLPVLEFVPGMYMLRCHANGNCLGHDRKALIPRHHWLSNL